MTTRESSFRPIASRRAFEEAVDQIAHAIRVGDMQVGERLPSERELSSVMAISRPTLREAVKVLVDAGIVEVRPGPGGGMFVKSDLIPAGLTEERLEMRADEIFGILEARRLFEPRVAQLAGLYGTESDFELMEKSIHLQRRDVGDRERFLQFDYRFHVLIARATQNATLISMMRHLLRRVELVTDMASRTLLERQKAVELHERTLAAIKSGDPDLIEEAMGEHLSVLERIFEEETGRPRVRRPPAFLVARGTETVRR